MFKYSTYILIKRCLIKLIKQPAAPLMGFFTSLFFLAVYNAGIGGIDFLDHFNGNGYFAFVFPVTIITLAMGSSAGAGQTLNNDMQSAYFRRLYLSPVSRYSLIIAPVIADTFSSFFFTVLMLLIGLLFSLPFQFGLLSFLGVLLLSLLWSITLCGFSTGLLLRTGQTQSASMVTSIVFSMIFLSTTFMPKELIRAKWLLFTAKINPLTYILEGNRYLLGGTADHSYFLIALIILLTTSFLSLIFAIDSARKIHV